MRELARVVKPGGRIASLEFGVPQSRAAARAVARATRASGCRCSAGSSRASGPRSAASSGRASRSFYARYPLGRQLVRWRERASSTVRVRRMSFGGGRRDERGEAWRRRRVSSSTGRRSTPCAPAAGATSSRSCTRRTRPGTSATSRWARPPRPRSYAGRLGAALAAFFLAVGVSAHALDELHGRPLRTRLCRPDADRARRRRAGRRRGDRRRRRSSSSRRCWSPFVVAGAFLVARLQPRARRRPLPHRRLVRRSRGARSRPSRATSSTRSRSGRAGVLVAARVLRAERRPAPAEHAGARAAAAHGRR